MNPRVVFAALAHSPAFTARALIRAYRLSLSSLVGGQCRYLPTCSAFMDDAIAQHGLWAGGWLGLSRLCRCHPWGSSGFDPVPTAFPADVHWALPWRYGQWRKPLLCEPLSPSELQLDLESSTAHNGKNHVERQHMTEIQGRKADHNIESLFLERWSPRAFAQDEIPEAELFKVFEAARWAPSCYNSQPWRFLYARRDTPAFATFLGLLGEFNQIWAKSAAALIFVVSKKSFTPPGKDQPMESPTYSFDTGAAWGFLALQASKSGWATHGMAGFDHARAPVELNVPAGYQVEIAVAIGKQGEKASLPESFQAREMPSGRNPINTLVFEGGFPQGETL